MQIFKYDSHSTRDARRHLRLRGRPNLQRDKNAGARLARLDSFDQPIAPAARRGAGGGGDSISLAMKFRYAASPLPPYTSSATTIPADLRRELMFVIGAFSFGAGQFLRIRLLAYVPRDD